MDNSRTGINSRSVASLFPMGNNVRQMNLNAKLNIVLAMQVFARVVEAGTFTKAADSLKMPKATDQAGARSRESLAREAPQPDDAPRDGHARRLRVLRTGRAA